MRLISIISHLLDGGSVEKIKSTVIIRDQVETVKVRFSGKGTDCQLYLRQWYMDLAPPAVFFIREKSTSTTIGMYTGDLSCIPNDIRAGISLKAACMCAYPPTRCRPYAVYKVWKSLQNEDYIPVHAHDDDDIRSMSYCHRMVDEADDYEYDILGSV